MLNKVVTLVSLGLLSSGVASANIGTIKPYVGGKIGYGKYAYPSDLKAYYKESNGSLDSEVASFGVVLGAKFNDRIGVEAGYTVMESAKYRIPGEEEGALKTRNIYIDLLGYLPINSRLNLFVSCGVGKFLAKTKTLDIDSNSTNANNMHKTSWRAGFGAQYKFNDRWSLLPRVNLQKVGKKGDLYIMKRHTDVSLTVAYFL